MYEWVVLLSLFNLRKPEHFSRSKYLVKVTVAVVGAVIIVIVVVVVVVVVVFLISV